MRARGAPPERYEARDLQERVHAAYAAAHQFPWIGGISFVNASGTPDEVAALVLAAVERRMRERSGA
jgi:hypothetical protein